MWLRSHQFDVNLAARAQAPLIVTRQAIRDATSRNADYHLLNDVLQHAQVVVQFDDHGLPRETVQIDDDAGIPSTRAALNLIELIRSTRPDQESANTPSAVLWFFDGTRNRSRLGCSMADCGNRAKAKRHYQRTRSRRP